MYTKGVVCAKGRERERDNSPKAEYKYQLIAQKVFRDTQPAGAVTCRPKRTDQTPGGVIMRRTAAICPVSASPLELFHFICD